MADATRVEGNATDIPIYQSNLPEAKALADLYSLHDDMQFVVNTLNRLLEENDGFLLQTFLSSALIAYRRLFTSGVRNGLKNADVSGLTKNQGDLHNYLRAQANKLIAHSVNPFEATKAGILVKDGRVIGVAKIGARLINFSEGQLKQWGLLTIEIHETVLKPRIRFAELALAQAAASLPIAEVINMPTLGVRTAEASDVDKRRQ